MDTVVKEKRLRGTLAFSFEVKWQDSSRHRWLVRPPPHPGLSSGRCLFYFLLQQNRVGDNCMRTPCLCPPPFLRSHGVYCPVHPSFIPEGIPLPPPPPRPCSCPTQGVVCRGRTVTCPVGSATQRLGEPLCASVCRMRMTRVSGPWGFCVGSTQITRYRERTSTQCLVGRKV